MNRLRHQFALVWLALFALVGDMALISAHRHDAPDLRARAVTEVIASAAAGAPCLPNLPHSHDHDCTICWTAAIAGTGVVPVPPAVSAPLIWTSLRLAPLTSPVSSIVIPLGFQARGPPAHVAV